MNETDVKLPSPPVKSDIAGHDGAVGTGLDVDPTHLRSLASIVLGDRASDEAVDPRDEDRRWRDRHRTRHLSSRRLASTRSSSWPGPGSGTGFSIDSIRLSPTKWGTTIVVGTLMIPFAERLR